MRLLFKGFTLTLATLAASLAALSAASPAHAGPTRQELLDQGLSDKQANYFLSPEYEAGLAAGTQLTVEEWLGFNQRIQQEGLAFGSAAIKAIDPSLLQWTGGTKNVEVFFINEGAGYQNQLLFTANDGPLQTIFNNVSSRYSILDNGDGPLGLGQGKSLGSFTQGSRLNFFLNSDGYSYGENLAGSQALTTTAGGEVVNQSDRLLGATPAQNRDKLSHMVAYQLNEWILLGFEDIVGGGDLDYNDTVFVVRGLREAGVSTPEPVSLAALGLVGLAAGRLRRRAAAEAK